jgi:hypothetical protein
MNVGIGTEATLFPEKEYIIEISFAVHTFPTLEVWDLKKHIKTLCRWLPNLKSELKGGKSWCIGYFLYQRRGPKNWVASVCQPGSDGYLSFVAQKAGGGGEALRC